MRYIYSEADNPQADDYFYEVRHITNNEFPVVPSHSHNFYEIYIFLNGSATLQIEENFFKVKCGDIIVTPPYVIHQLLEDEPKKLPYERMYMYISEPCLMSFQFNEHSPLKYFKVAQKNNRYHFQLGNDSDYDVIKSLMLEIKNAQEENDFGKELLNRANILKLITLLSKHIMSDLEPRDITLLDNPLIEKVIKYINDNYMENLSVDMLANNFFVSRSYLSNEFKQYTSHTLHNYLTMKRINVSKQEMSQGLLPSEVAIKVGFSDYSTFYRAFSKQEGISPKEFYKKSFM